MLGGSFYNAQSGLRATGVPCHLIVAQAVEELGKDVVSLREEVVALKDTIPERVKDKILESFQINGAVPLTREDVGRMFVDMRDQMIEAIRGQGGQRDPPAMAVTCAGADGGGTVEADGYGTEDFILFHARLDSQSVQLSNCGTCIGLVIRSSELRLTAA